MVTAVRQAGRPDFASLGWRGNQGGMMREKPEFLKSCYGLDTVSETREFYNQWADSYDEEIAQNGYETPHRCANALAKTVKDLSAPVLDVGCGTGLSGLALHEAGFTTIDGCDLSPEMLLRAEKRKGLYRKLWLIDVNQPFDLAIGTYQNIVATGVVASGHAPAATIDNVLKILPKGGCFVLSLNDHTLKDPGFEARIAENIDTGNAVLTFREYGRHLLGLNMKSNVYVLQKT